MKSETKMMQEAIEKSRALIEAMEYIRRFKGKIIVVKLGGSVLDDLDAQEKMLTDIVFMATVGMRPVIVHGGGKAITRAMQHAGLEPVWVQGRRYTDQRTLTIVEHTLVNQVNKGICTTIERLGCDVMPLTSLSSCVLSAKPFRLENEDGRKIDLGLVGQMTDVNATIISKLCKSKTIPVIAPVAIDKSGQKLNVNADAAAAHVAAAVRAEKIVFVSDTHGILENIDDPESTISSLNESQIQKMIEDGSLTTGMMPKVDACLHAIDNGVKKAHIIDGRIQHSLLLEIYTDKGIGTQIIR